MASDKFNFNFTKIRTICVLLIGVSLVVSLSRNISIFVEANRQVAKDKEKLALLEEENGALQKELGLMDSDEYREKQVRDKLGQAKEGETVLILPEDEVLRRFSPIRPENQYDELPDPNWKKWAKLFF